MKILATVLILLMFGFCNAIVKMPSWNPNWWWKSVPQDTKFPNLSEKFVIPYVGKHMMVAGREYSVRAFLEMMNDINTDVVSVVQSNMEINDKVVNFDFANIKRSMDSLKVVSGIAKGKKIKSLLSAVNLKVKRNGAADSYVIDILKLPKTNLKDIQIYRDNISIEYCLKPEKRSVAFGGINEKTVINSFISEKVRVRAYDSTLETEFDCFRLEFPGITAKRVMEKNLPVLMKGEFLKVFITRGDVQANIDMSDHEYWNRRIFADYKLSYIKIPYFDDLKVSMMKKEFSIEYIYYILQDYTFILRHCVYESLNRGYDFIDLAQLESCLEIHSIKYPLQDIGVIHSDSIGNKDLDKNDFIKVFYSEQMNKNKKFELNEGRDVLLFKLSLTDIKYRGKSDKIKFNVEDFDIDADAYIAIDTGPNFMGWRVLGSNSFVGLSVRMYADAPELNFGVFKGTLDNGKPKTKGRFTYSVNIWPYADNPVDGPVLVYE